MKKLLVALVVIVTIVVVTPKIIGSVVEQEREKAILDINNAEGFTFETLDYQSSWFGADVTSSLTIAAVGDSVVDINITFQETLSFGPVILTDNGWHFGLAYSDVNINSISEGIDEEVLNKVNDKTHLGGLLGFNKSVTTFIEVEAFSHKVDGNAIISGPASANFTVVNNDYIKGAFSWQGFEFNESGQRFVMNELAMATEQKVISGDYLAGTAILTGDSSVSVGKVDIYDEGVHAFSLADSKFSSVVSLDNDMLEIELKYHAAEVGASGQNFTKPNLDIIISNVDLKALQELNASLANLPDNTKDNPEELLKLLSGIIEKAVAKDPALTIADLSVVTDEGKIESNWNVTLNKDLLDLQHLNSMSFIMALEADAKGKVPVSFLTKFGVEPMANNFVEQGYLTKQGDDISFDAKYTQAALTLNGKAFQM